ncbi:MAG: EthD family reductase [Xanthobacteraceae bacterium]
MRKPSRPGETRIDRRSALTLGVAATAALAAVGGARAEGKGEVKITVLYGTPKSPDDFEKYYLGTHMPMVYKISGIKRTELAKCISPPGAPPPPFYRVTELWFDSPEAMQKVMATPEMKKVGEDVPNFASGGATILVSIVE